MGTSCASLRFGAQGKDRPNVILIITDDQGYGDLGVMGNPVIQTPNIDAMARRSGSMTNFHVHPVCAPTRACLMTGRYNYRTRVVDTYVGRAMMEPEEVTLAEILRDAGYETGIFGKWHLGDNYPMRPKDQGFTESLVHRGGGIGQPADPRPAARGNTPTPSSSTTASRPNAKATAPTSTSTGRSAGSRSVRNADETSSPTSRPTRRTDPSTTCRRPNTNTTNNRTSATSAFRRTRAIRCRPSVTRTNGPASSP